VPHIKRGSANIYYESHGSGPALLLTHGFTATSRMWQNQIDALSQNHQLIIWDIRGHGESALPLDAGLYSADLTVDDMRALLDQVGAERAILGGHSLGGYMSLRFFMRYPERVRALLLFNTGPGFKQDEARDKWNANVNRLADKLQDRGLDALGRGAEALGNNHKSIESLALAGRGITTQQTADVIESLPTIDVPSLVLVGENDKAFLNAASYMSERIKGANSVTLQDAGHAANIDQPAAFNEATLAFLNVL